MSSFVVNRVNRAKRQRRGLTLIEAAMVLTIFALTVAGVMLFYQNATNSQKLSSTAQQISAVQQAVANMYAGQPTKTGLKNADIEDSLPRSMVASAGELRHAFNGEVDVKSATGSSYTITFGGLPSDACRRLATIDLGRNVISLTVGTVKATQVPMLPSEAQAACGQTNASTLAWELF